MVDGTGVFYANGAGHAEAVVEKEGNVKIKKLGPMVSQTKNSSFKIVKSLGVIDPKEYLQGIK